MRIIAQHRYQLTSVIGSDKYAYGDLFGITYLPQFKMQQPVNGTIKVDSLAVKRDINLFGLVDSHVFSFVKSDTVFYGVKKYWYSTWNDYTKQEAVKIDTKQKNVLLLEVVEHNIRLFADTNYVLNKLLATSNKEPIPHHVANSTSGSLGDKLKNSVFDKKINENLEFNLFNYRFFSPLKELKATLNYKLFNRIDNDVMLSANGKYLYLKSTCDTGYESSFYPTPQYKIDRIVSALNAVYDHYKAIGFDDVCFTMVPNPVSILDPGFKHQKYNYLIPRIQSDPRLKIKIIDLYNLYKNTKLQVYKNSDTHYTNTGYQLWIQELNKHLKDVDNIKK